MLRKFKGFMDGVLVELWIKVKGYARMVIVGIERSGGRLDLRMEIKVDGGRCMSTYFYYF